MSSLCYSSLLNQQKHTFLSVFFVVVVGMGNCIFRSRIRSDQNDEPYLLTAERSSDGAVKALRA